MTIGQALRFVISHQGKIEWQPSGLAKIMITHPYLITVEAVHVVEGCFAINKMIEERERGDSLSSD